MRVERVVSPNTSAASWTVLDGQGMVEPVEQFLAHLTGVERSPNTVRAYAHDLRDFFAFLNQVNVAWAEVSAEDLGAFVRWLRLPRAARQGPVLVLPGTPPGVGAATVNRKLAAVSAFYLFHHRQGVDVRRALAGWQRGGRRGGTYEPMLAHLRGVPLRRSSVSLPTQRIKAPVLTDEQVRKLVAGCERLRDRFLLMLLAGSGMRIGEALGLRHEDIDVSAPTVSVRSRINVNHARAKTWSRDIPVDPKLIHAYSDYLHQEYGDLDSDYVFVNLWRSPVGRPMTYSSVYSLVKRLRTSTGISFGPHTFRHSYATALLQRGTPVQVVRDLMGHASISTTVDTYGHLTVDDTRRALVVAGFLPATAEGPR